MQYLDTTWEIKQFFTFSRKFEAMIKIKIKKLDDDDNYFSLILRAWVIFRKLAKCWKLSCEIMKKLSMVIYPFYFIN